MSTPLQVEIQTVALTDDDGGRAARVTPAQFARWVTFASDAFRGAGIAFTFDPARGFHRLASTALNSMAGAADASWPEVKALGNRVAARFPGRLVVLVRHGPAREPSAAAFAGIDHDFVVMGGFDAMSHCGHPHVDALAHEIGHYLGLPHTFVGDPFPDVAAAAAHLAEHDDDPRAFDGDGFTDTPPDPAIRAFECERRSEVVLRGQTFVLPRRNLMSYYDERDSLSPQQVARVRWVLERRRANGMRLPANRPRVGAFEAESLEIVHAHGCTPAPQEMTPYGAGLWSGNSHLFCGATEGAELTLALPDRGAGDHGLVLYATLAPDFGIVQCRIDDRACGPPLDLHAPMVLPTGGIPIARFELPRGAHRLRFEVLGRNAASEGFHFGLDALEFVD